MDPFTLSLILGAGAGGGKSILDMVGRDSDKQLQAATTRYSPWTGMKAPEPRKVDAFGNLLKGALSGATINSMIPKEAGAVSGYGPTVAGSDSGLGSLGPWNGGDSQMAVSPWYGVQRNPAREY